MPIRTRLYGMKLEYKDLGLQKILQDAARVVSVRVGVVGARAAETTADGRLTNAENAVIQTYGLGGAPRRDMLNKPFADARTLVASILRKIPGKVVRGESPEAAADAAGYELEKIARDAIMGPPGIGPKNAPRTIERKGFDHPLIDHLDLYNSISHRVVREGGDVLEAGSSTGDYEMFEIGGSAGGGGE